MGKVKSRYRKGNKLLKIFEGKGYLRGVMYEFVWDVSVSPNKCSLVKTAAANFYEKDNEATDYRVRQYFGMLDARSVSSDNYIDVNHRVIWSNNNYDEWEECMKQDYPDGVDEDGEKIELTYERYYEDCDNYLWDERANLNVPVDGVIVAFADLGLWDGRHQGSGICGTNVKDILHSNCDYLDWYCDRYNVRCTAIHHDGRNHYLYRVAKDEQEADRIAYAIAYEDMTEEQFRKATRSLRPYVAKVYGW